MKKLKKSDELHNELKLIADLIDISVRRVLGIRNAEGMQNVLAGANLVS